MADLTTSSDIDAFLDAADNAAARTLLGVPSLAANTFTALQTITQDSANAGVLASTGYSLTGSNASKMIDLAGTWNTTGAPTAIKLNITNTASDAASLLFDLQVGGTSQFKVTPGGYTTCVGLTARNCYLGVYDASLLLINNNDAAIVMGAGNDIYLSRAAADTLELASQYGGGSTLRINGDNLTGAEYLSLGHNGTNAVIGVTGGSLHISGLPTSNPGAGILWNDSGTVKVGT